MDLDSRSSIPTVHHVFDSTLHGLAVALNIALLLVMKSASAKKPYPFRATITATCLSDIALSIGYFLCQPAAFEVDGSTIILSNGFLALRWPQFDLFTHVLCAAVLIANIAFLPFPFAIRFFCVCRGCKPSMRLIASLCIFPLLQTLVGTLSGYNLMVTGGDFQDWAATRLQKMQWYPAGNASLSDFISGAHWSDSRTLIQLAVATVTTQLSIVQIVWYQRRVIRHLRLPDFQALPERTRRMHAELNRALIVFAVTPIALSGTSMMFFNVAVAFQLQIGLLGVAAMTQASFVSAANPIAAMILIRPFRRELTTWLAAKPKAVSTTVTAASKGAKKASQSSG